MQKPIKIIVNWKSILIIFIVSLFFLPSGFAAELDVTLQWHHSIDKPYLTSYKIYYDTDSRTPPPDPPEDPYDQTPQATYYRLEGADWVEINNNDPVTIRIEDFDEHVPQISLRFSDETQPYFFAVTAVDTRGLESDYSNEVVTDDTPPGAAVINGDTSSALNVFHNTVTINWTAAVDPSQGSGIDGYSIVWDKITDTTPPETKNLGAVTTVSNSSLAEGSGYYFHIRAVDVAGNWALASDVSHYGPFGIDTTTPSIDSATVDFSGNTIDVAYSENDMRNAATKENYSFNFGLVLGVGTDSSGTNKVFQFPLTNLEDYIVYTLTVNSNITDAAGNEVSNKTVTINDDNTNNLADKWENDHSSEDNIGPNEDYDNDGLTNAAESKTHGTDPGSDDTDNDGMKDGWEVAYDGLDPFVDDAAGDADNDGISNLDEYNAGTDPTNDNIAPQAVLLSPNVYATEVPLAPTLQTEEYGGTETHIKTQWQISKANNNTDGDFSDIEFDVTSTSHLESITVPEFVLNVDQIYSWRARFYDALNGGVIWSATRWFTTTTTNPLGADGVAAGQAVPHGTVDLDGEDGNDTYSNTFRAVNTVVGNGQIGVKVRGGISIDALESIDPATISDNTGKPTKMPLGLIQFKLSGVPVGPVQVEIYLSQDTAADAVWYKYDNVNGWKDYSANAPINANKVILTLVDGGVGDADGVANGIIVDPSGAGSPGSGAPSAPVATTVSSSGGGCFIATAAFGSPLDKHVDVLQHLRDDILLLNKWGQGFVKTYYRYSPPVADFIKDHDTLRLIVRWSLLPVVALSWVTLQIGAVPTLLLIFMVLSAGWLFLIKYSGLKHRVKVQGAGYKA